jgi:hypothetical protein
VFAALVLAAGASLGWGLGIAVNQFRIMALNSVTEWTTTDPTRWPLPLFAGLFGGMVVRMLFARAQRSWTGGPIRIAPTFFTMLGVAAGFFLYSLRWTTPTSVGESVDKVFGGNEAWDLRAWVMYYANLWVPAVCVIAAIIALVARLVFAARVSNKLDRVQQAVARGIQVPGVVNSVEYTGVRVHGQPLEKTVVSFTDLSGQTRWVTKRGTFNLAQVPRAGDAVTVFFDPATISDEKTIVVDFATAQVSQSNTY